MSIRPEVFPFLVAVMVVLGIPGSLLLMRGGIRRRLAWVLLGLELVSLGFLLYFFRDPERRPPRDPTAIVAGADGRVTSVTNLREDTWLRADCVRISIFLSLLDVHVNRAPLAGHSEFLGYFPGRHFFTFQEKSSEFNQHNKILVTGQGTRCLVAQIVGPVCRRVVYWPPHDSPVPVARGDRIGMMKFGSRLDMYLPAAEVEILCRPGDAVRAGETVVARVASPAAPAD